MTGAEIYAMHMREMFVDWAVTIAEPDMNKRVGLIRGISELDSSKLDHYVTHYTSTDTVPIDWKRVNTIAKKVGNLFFSQVFTDGTPSINTIENAEQVLDQLNERDLLGQITDIKIFSQQYHDLGQRLRVAFRSAFRTQEIHFFRTDKVIEDAERMVFDPTDQTRKHASDKRVPDGEREDYESRGPGGLYESPTKEGMIQAVGGALATLVDRIIMFYNGPNQFFNRILAHRVKKERLGS